MVFYFWFSGTSACLRLGFFPCQWKQAQIVIFLEPHKPSERPEIIQSHLLHSKLAKILEIIIGCRISKLSEDNHLLTSTQHRFRPSTLKLHFNAFNYDDQFRSLCRRYVPGHQSSIPYACDSTFPSRLSDFSAVFWRAEEPKSG